MIDSRSNLACASGRASVGAASSRDPVQAPSRRDPASEATIALRSRPKSRLEAAPTGGSRAVQRCRGAKTELAGTGRRRARGFTLVEVLIALVVVSLGLAAIAKQTGQSARTARLVQVKTLASWIAMNKLTEMRLIEGVPSAGTDSDEIEFAGRDWFWESEIVKPSDDVNNFMRIEVAVSLADSREDVLAFVTGFIGRGPSAANRQPWDVRTGGPASGPGSGTPGADAGNDGRPPAIDPQIRRRR